MMAVFCTNSINIIAGVNGVEAGQTVVIAGSIVVFNLLQLHRLESQEWQHILSICFLLPLCGTACGLLRFNWYPARVFVGDTFCYWAGMTIAVAGILGHFSKTMILFLLPQVFNFVYSLPQLFHLVPCPRHRLPKFDSEKNVVGMSFAEFKASEAKPLGHVALKIFELVGLLHREDFEKDGEMWIRISNLTILNLILKFSGPMREDTLTACFLVLQVAFSFVGLIIRFHLAGLVYDVVN
uniref:UDP-N-acetylglucosamine--dolichyl-phosphate N-acetylglucosaminephosphotransferase n=1 Tax=Steinernema glaseri TaxID=37863 RepID=A0A1I8AGN3_9BILA